MPLIALLETVDESAHRELEKNAAVFVAPTPETRLPVEVQREVEAIVTRGRGRVTPELIESCPRLRVVARCGVGLDNIDVVSASARGIAVINAPGSTTTTVAEHTVMLILALQRQLFPMVHAVKADHWAARNEYRGDECSQKTLGIVGLGAIGSRVAEIAMALGMQVIYWNRSPRETTYAHRSMEALLTEADVVTLHTALTPETKSLFDRNRLALMRPGALLVNTARGAVVDRTALLEALESGHLAGYAADGIETEPPEPGDPLLHHPRTLITPHSAALTRSTYTNICVRTVHNLLRYLSNSTVEPGCVFNAKALA